MASFLQAKSQRGAWLLRIDDLDRPRCMPGAAGVIQRQLEEHGLQWDEPVRWQSAHVDEYEAALRDLQQMGALYACDCTRAQLGSRSLPGPGGPIYPGFCRDRAVQGRSALRFRVPRGIAAIVDPWQHELVRDLETEVGDFVVRRADGVIGYQLACVVDEVAQEITEVVRGADLIGSSLRQAALLGAWGKAAPAYRHLAVLTDASGRKLSKQNHAPALPAGQAGRNLLECLELLNQAPPATLLGEEPPKILDWAVSNWKPERVPGPRSGRDAVQHRSYNATQQNEESFE